MMFTNALPANYKKLSSAEIIQRAHDVMNAIKEKHVRSMAEMVGETTCDVCGRKPTVTYDERRGEVVWVCRHIFDALKKRLPRASTRVDPVAALSAMQFRVFDDGPARF